MTASFVLDASLTLSWCFPDEKDDAALRLLPRMATETAAVPALWLLEVANGVIVGQRRQRIKRHQADEFMRLVNGFDLDIDEGATHRAHTHILDLARAETLSSYDAVYLELAIRRRLPLATTDGPLAQAAKRVGVPLLT